MVAQSGRTIAYTKLKAHKAELKFYMVPEFRPHNID
jgi:hypothetical protein